MNFTGEAPFPGASFGATLRLDGDAATIVAAAESDPKALPAALAEAKGLLLSGGVASPADHQTGAAAAGTAAPIRAQASKREITGVIADPPVDSNISCESAPTLSSCALQLFCAQARSIRRLCKNRNLSLDYGDG